VLNAVKVIRRSNSVAVEFWLPQLRLTQCNPDAIIRFAPGTTVCIISDVRRYTPAGRYAVESRVDRVERLESVERVRVEAEDVAKERRSASLICQDDDILGFEFDSSS